VQRSPGRNIGGQAISVQADWFRQPSAPQRQVLQPSAASKTWPGQHKPSSRAGVASIDSERGISGHASFVHLASSRSPLLGQRQEFRPSPAGKDSSGSQVSFSTECGQWREVQRDSLFSPLDEQMQLLQLSLEKTNPGQQLSAWLASLASASVSTDAKICKADAMGPSEI